MGASAPPFISTLSGAPVDEYSLIPFRVNYRQLFEPAPRPLAELSQDRVDKTNADVGSPKSDAALQAAVEPSDVVLDSTGAGGKTFVVDSRKRFEPSPAPLVVLDDSRVEQKALTRERDDARRRMQEHGADDSPAAQKPDVSPSPSSSDPSPFPVASDSSTDTSSFPVASDSPSSSDPSSSDDSSASSVSSDSMSSFGVLAVGLFGLLLVLMWFGSQMAVSNSPANSLISAALVSYPNSSDPVSDPPNQTAQAFVSSTPSNSSALSPFAPPPQAVYLRIGDEARMPDGSLLRLEAIQAINGGLSARLALIDANGRNSFLDLTTGQRAQWRGNNGSEYQVQAQANVRSNTPGLRIAVYGARDIQRPAQIRFSAPAYAYLLNGQYPVPILLDNATLSVGQSVQGGNLRAQLVGIEYDLSGRSSSHFRLFDNRGDEVGLTTLENGQMVEMRTPGGERYTLLMRSSEAGASRVQLYLNQAFNQSQPTINPNH